MLTVSFMCENGVKISLCGLHALAYKVHVLGCVWSDRGGGGGPWSHSVVSHSTTSTATSTSMSGRGWSHVCARQCAASNSTVSYGHGVIRAGLSDRISVLGTLGNFALDLCALAVLPPPCALLGGGGSWEEREPPACNVSCPRAALHCPHRAPSLIAVGAHRRACAPCVVSCTGLMVSLPAARAELRIRVQGRPAGCAAAVGEERGRRGNRGTRHTAALARSRLCPGRPPRRGRPSIRLDAPSHRPFARAHGALPRRAQRDDAAAALVPQCQGLVLNRTQCTAHSVQVHC